MSLPWGALPMGTSPGCHRGDTVITPALLAAGAVMAGRRTSMYSGWIEAGSITVSKLDRAPMLSRAGHPRSAQYGRARKKQIPISLICIDNATVTSVSPTEKHIEHTVVAYWATADADNDGYPDPGSTPMGTFTATSISKRLGR